MYWSFVPTWSHAHYLARHAGVAKPGDVFHASGPDTRRLAASMPDFISHFKGLANWVRLSILLSALSYFEVYVRRIVRLSLWSDPAVQFGKSKAIDGVSWIKRELKNDLDTLIVSCVKGTWQSRIASLEKIFSSAPRITEEKLALLDELRILRNKVGHMYGRNETDDPHIFKNNTPMIKLSEEELKNQLQLIFDVAIDTDRFFLERHIGSFELLLYFHKWRAARTKYNAHTEAREFKREVNRQKTSRNLSLKYFEEMVLHYESC